MKCEWLISNILNNPFVEVATIFNDFDNKYIKTLLIFFCLCFFFFFSFHLVFRSKSFFFHFPALSTLKSTYLFHGPNFLKYLFSYTGGTTVNVVTDQFKMRRTCFFNFNLSDVIFLLYESLFI